MSLLSPSVFFFKAPTFLFSSIFLILIFYYITKRFILRHFSFIYAFAIPREGKSQVCGNKNTFIHMWITFPFSHMIFRRDFSRVSSVLKVYAWRQWDDWGIFMSTHMILLLTCNSASETSISPRYTNSMMNWRSAKATSGGIIMIGCLHGFSISSFWKNDEHADNTTYK